MRLFTVPSITTFRRFANSSLMGVDLPDRRLVQAFVEKYAVARQLTKALKLGSELEALRLHEQLREEHGKFSLDESAGELKDFSIGNLYFAPTQDESRTQIVVIVHDDLHNNQANRTCLIAPVELAYPPGQATSRDLVIGRPYEYFDGIIRLGVMREVQASGLGAPVGQLSSETIRQLCELYLSSLGDPNAQPAATAQGLNESPLARSLELWGAKRSADAGEDEEVPIQVRSDSSDRQEESSFRPIRVWSVRDRRLAASDNTSTKLVEFSDAQTGLTGQLRYRQKKKIVLLTLDQPVSKTYQLKISAKFLKDEEFETTLEISPENSIRIPLWEEPDFDPRQVQFEVLINDRYNRTT